MSWVIRLDCHVSGQNCWLYSAHHLNHGRLEDHRFGKSCFSDRNLLRFPRFRLFYVRAQVRASHQFIRQSWYISDYVGQLVKRKYLHYPRHRAFRLNSFLNLHYKVQQDGEQYLKLSCGWLTDEFISAEVRPFAWVQIEVLECFLSWHAWSIAISALYDLDTLIASVLAYPTTIKFNGSMLQTQWIHHIYRWLPTLKIPSFGRKQKSHISVHHGGEIMPISSEWSFWTTL